MGRVAIAMMLLAVATAFVPSAPRAAEANMLDYRIEGDAVPRPLGGLDGDAARGVEIAVDRTRGNCLACHTVPSLDAPFQGRIGPSLKGVAKRLNVGQIRLRMIDQSRINPNTMMPPYYRVKGLANVAPELRGKPALDAQELEDIVAWLATLKD